MDSVRNALQIDSPSASNDTTVGEKDDKTTEEQKSAPTFWNLVPELTENDQAELRTLLKLPPKTTTTAATVDEPAVRLKIGVYGRTGVGKTAFIERMTTNQFTSYRRPKASSHTCKSRVVDGEKFSLEFLDCEADFLTSILQMDMLQEMKAFVFIFDSQASVTQDLINHVQVIRQTVLSRLNQMESSSNSSETTAATNSLSPRSTSTSASASGSSQSQQVKRVKWKELPILVLFNMKSEVYSWETIREMKELVDAQFKFHVPFIAVNIGTNYQMDLVSTQLVRIAVSKMLHFVDKYSQDRKSSCNLV